MLRAALITSLVSVTTLVAFAPHCAAQNLNWKEIFPVRKHDFGTVAVAAKTEFSFPIENLSNRPIHIRTVRASCGCTTGTGIFEVGAADVDSKNEIFHRCFKVLSMAVSLIQISPSGVQRTESAAVQQDTGPVSRSNSRAARLPLIMRRRPT